MKYEITAISFWVKPQTFFADSDEEKDEIVFDLKNQQYKVEISRLTSN